VKSGFTFIFLLKITPVRGFNFIKQLMNIFNSIKKQDVLLGKRGEKAALDYLKKNGYKILATNFFNPSGRRLGEIDIIARDGDEIVFVEVKTRNQPIFNKVSLPEENINRAKLRKLNKIASFYLTKNALTEFDYRFDAITLMANIQKSQAKLRHLKNIFL